MNNIVDFFFTASKSLPNNVAIIQGKRKITYDELAAEIEMTASYFTEKGIGKGDRVLVFVPMGIDLYRIVLALFSIGATAVFLDEWVSKKRMELCCEIADCKGFIGLPKIRLLSFLSRELRRIPVKLSLKRMSSRRIQAIKLEPSETALITFTTGSTGRPKAAKRSHGFLKEQFDALIEEIQPNSDDVDMPVLPIVLMVNLGVGCTSVIAEFSMKKPNRNNFDLIANQIREFNVSRITASPFFVSELSNYASKHNTSFPELKKIFTGGAPVFPSNARKYTEAFSGIDVNIVYGSTEAEPISLISAFELSKEDLMETKGLLVGKVYHKTQLAIIPISNHPIEKKTSVDFKNMELEEGSIGEIVVSGPHVLAAYYNSPMAFKENKILVDDAIWHRTGDSGFLNDGSLYLTGRCSQLIYRNDEVLSPFIIENQLEQIDGVTCGTLLSFEKKLVLIVESEESRRSIEERVSSIDFDELVLLSRIPKDPRHNSKIDYEKLKELIVN